jgi:hypothetical protein
VTSSVALRREIRKANEDMTKEKLRAIYKIVYQDNSHWLEAIESYLR